MRRTKKVTKKSKTSTTVIDSVDDVKSKKITEYFSPTALVKDEIKHEVEEINEARIYNDTPPSSRVSHRVPKDDTTVHDTEHNGDIKVATGEDEDDVKVRSSEEKSVEEQPSPIIKVKKKRRSHIKVSSNKPTSPQIKKPARQRHKNKQAAAGGEESTGNRQITEYFHVRRSKRVPQSQLKKEFQDYIEDMILSECEDGLKVVEYPDKGRGVAVTRQFSAGQYVVEYAGELVDMCAARHRETQYSVNGAGCYMYYFEHCGERHCIDATSESGRLGRLINHSIKRANLMSKTFVAGGTPRIIFTAKRDISEDEELLYDYGERDKEAIATHPWLTS